MTHFWVGKSVHFDDFHDFGGRYHEALDFFIEFSFLSRAQRGLRQPNAEKTMDDRHGYRTSYSEERPWRTSPEVKEFQWFLKGRRPPPPPYLPLCYDLILMKMRVGVRRGGVRKLGSWRVGKLDSWEVGKVEVGEFEVGSWNVRRREVGELEVE